MVRRSLFRMLLVTYLAGCSSHAIVLGGSPPEASKLRLAELQGKLARIVEESQGREESIVALQQFPEDELVLAVTDALTRGVYQDGKLRGFCYRVLSDYGAVKSEDGYKAMLACLEDSRNFLGLCAGALTTAPAEKLPEVADRLATILTAEETSLRDQEIVLKSLAKIGKPAAAHLATVEGILRNPQGDDRIRGFAATAVLDIGGAKRALEILPKLDQTGLRESMGPLGKFAGESQGTFGTDDKETRHKMRAFMRQCMQNADPQIREIAAQGFVGAFSADEIWLGDPSQGFTVNPQYHEAWEYMARNDPDETFRLAARKRLEEIQKSQIERNRK